ncbi:flagellar motor switch protein FliN/FliY [Litorivivens lipolytica]|uniref:Flagellar motor switch protein FliN n=1 Tax=Litorivivens lipolytica TaxID=1524264 RepID=A0A7W4Z5T3_9GAMM|nr:flagellar motor switch protein FliN [Litorivivens lipolytica]MBB3046205.1 flagellar motor switch protein FliN/FliY [Litorivivens lipolytica]
MSDFKTLGEQSQQGVTLSSTQRDAERSGDTPVASSRASLERVMDIPVRISMEVGSAEISVRDLLDLRQGAVVELERQAGEPLDVLVNGSLVARGEVVVVNDQLGIRLTELVSPADRARALSKEE